MKVNKKLTYLKTNVKSGVSKAGKPYEITELTFMDEEYEQITVGASREVQRNHMDLVATKAYNVTLDLGQRGFNKTVELYDFKDLAK